MKAFSMTTKTLGLASLPLLVACGTASTTSESPPEPTHDQAVVALRSTHAEGMSAAPIALADVTVSAGDRALPVRMDTAVVDLANPEEAVTARFAVPTDAETVRVVVTFDDYGGFEATDGTAGVIEARGVQSTVDVPTEALSRSGRIALELDVARSLAVRNAETRVLTPQVAATY